MNSTQPILSLNDVRVRFGGLLALDIDRMDVPDTDGTPTIFMGPNGAGKSTLFAALTGYVPVSKGARITMNAGRAVQLVGLSRAGIVRKGIARTFQTPVLFPSISVREGVLISGLMAQPGTRAGQRLRLLGFPARDGVVSQLARELIESLDLSSMADAMMAGLPLTWLRRAELARCIATQPRVLLLDEPSAGADASETDFLIKYLGVVLPRLVGQLNSARRYRYERVTVGVITHDLVLAEGLAKVSSSSPIVNVLDQGKLLISAPLGQVVRDERVRNVYLRKEKDRCSGS